MGRLIVFDINYFIYLIKLLYHPLFANVSLLITQKDYDLFSWLEILIKLNKLPH